jgi:hypothetical protein
VARRRNPTFGNDPTLAADRREFFLVLIFHKA